MMLRWRGYAAGLTGWTRSRRFGTSGLLFSGGRAFPGDTTGDDSRDVWAPPRRPCHP